MIKNQRSFISRVAGRMAALLVAALTLAPDGVMAQSVTCDNAGDFPCAYQLRAVRLQPVPNRFRFQARVSQAKLPIGEGHFDTVFVQVVRGGSEVLCTEQFRNVQITQSVLNLEIGGQMTCELDEVIAENADLAFKVCLGSQDSCLRPIPLGTVPYAVKAGFARVSNEADTANTAAQANYAHRVTADRQMFLTKELGTGYFDFYTPPADRASGIYTADEFAAYADGAFLQWSPVRSPDASLPDAVDGNTLHIVGKDHDLDRLVDLDALVLRANVVSASAAVNVGSDLAVANNGTVGGLLVIGPPDSAATHRVTIWGDDLGGLDVRGDTMVTGKLDVTSTLTAQNGADIAGYASVVGPLNVTPPANDPTGGDATFGGAVIATGAISTEDKIKVADRVVAEVDGNDLRVGSDGVVVVGNNLEVDPSGDVTVTGDLDISQTLRVGGTIYAASFESATSDVDDPRYLLVGDTRDEDLSLETDFRIGTYGLPKSLTVNGRFVGPSSGGGLVVRDLYSTLRIDGGWLDSTSQINVNPFSKRGLRVNGDFSLSNGVVNTDLIVGSSSARRTVTIHGPSIGSASTGGGLVIGSLRLDSDDIDANGTLWLNDYSNARVDVGGELKVHGTLNSLGAVVVGTTSSRQAVTINGPSMSGASAGGALVIGSLRLDSDDIDVNGTLYLNDYSEARVDVSGELKVHGNALIGYERKRCEDTGFCNCSAGKKAIGGGGSCGLANVYPYRNYASSESQWDFRCANNATPDFTIVICARVGN